MPSSLGYLPIQHHEHCLRDLYGADGSTHSYRVSGLVSSPDTITSMFGSRTYSPLVMKPGNKFTCIALERHRNLVHSMGH